MYGSGGNSLLISPQAVNRSAYSPLAGPIVVVDDTSGDTSGRFVVAEVLARVFPTGKAFVRQVMEMFDQKYEFGPYPNDKLTVQTPRLVQFQTPPRSEGLGTMGRLKANDDPIDGVAILQGSTPDLLMLRVRLPRELRDLAPIIIHQFERDNPAK